jgi:hypothetical protein
VKRHVTLISATLLAASSVLVSAQSLPSTSGVILEQFDAHTVGAAGPGRATAQARLIQSQRALSGVDALSGVTIVLGTGVQASERQYVETALTIAHDVIRGHYGQTPQNTHVGIYLDIEECLDAYLPFMGIPQSQRDTWRTTFDQFPIFSGHGAIWIWLKAGPGTPLPGQSTWTHESVHILQGELSHGSTFGARWLWEGDAQRVSDPRTLDAWRTLVTGSGWNYPLSDLEDMRIFDSSHPGSYSVAAFAIEYLRFKYGGDAAVVRFWNELAREPWTTAFQIAFGASVSEFYADFETFRGNPLGPGSSCTSFTLSTTSASATVNGGNATVTLLGVPAGCTSGSWAATGNGSWLTVSSTGGTGPSTVTVSWTGNNSPSGRSGTATIAGNAFVVTQAGTSSATCSSFTLSHTSASATVNGDNWTLTLLGAPAGCTGGTWTASVNASWLTLSATSGSGPSTVTVFWTGNSNPSGRSATATIAGNAFVVSQAGTSSATCTSFMLSSTSAAATVNGGNQAVTLTGAPAGCAGGTWTASVNVPWLTLSASSGSGPSTVTVFWTGNNNPSGRSGTATIAGSAFVVNQAGTSATSCTSFTLSSSSASGTVNASNVTVTLLGAPAGCTGGSWVATGNGSWITVWPTSGTGPSTVTVYWIGNNNPQGRSSSATIAGRTFAVLQAGTTIQGPFGAFDTPAGDATVLSGSIAVSGWALDDFGVKRVEVWRDLQAGEPTAPFPGTSSDPRTGKIFIGNAMIVEGARPDIEQLYPALPHARRAGWGYLLLTWGLYGQGNGTYTFYAVAVDEEDNAALIGSKTVVVDNAHATKPFGSIDTPEIGGNPGTSPNFGWALTPKVNGVGTCRIPSNGIQVSIDSRPLQPVVYGDVRSDIATAFPGFSNSSAAGAHALFDWSSLTNGTHTIGWLITDDCGRADGVGSRFFTVSNGAAASAESTGAGATRGGLEAVELESAETVLLLRGENELPEVLDVSKSRIVEIKQGQYVQLRLPRDYTAAYRLVGDERRPLPVGSTWDEANGIFYWRPAVGFLGRHELAFTSRGRRITVLVVIEP